MFSPSKPTAAVALLSCLVALPLSVRATDSTISGTVRSVAPIANTQVSAERYESGRWELYFSAQTGSDGRYLMPVDSAAGYRVCAGGLAFGWIRQCFDHRDQGALAGDQSYDPVAPIAGENLTNRDFDLHAGGSISGTLHDGHTGQPLTNIGALLTVYDQNGDRLDSTGFLTNADGTYRVAGLPDGTFYVGIDASPAFGDGSQIFPDIVCQDTCPPATEGQAIAIAGGSTASGVDFTLHPDVIVSGRVTDAQSGIGVSGAEVGAYAWAGSLGVVLAYDTIANQDGYYELYVPGNDALYFAAEANAPLIDQVYPGIACIPTVCVSNGSVFSTQSGTPIAGIDFALEHGAAISGHVVDALTGAPLFASVQLYDADYRPIWNGGGNPDGTYTTAAWTPGTYYVEAVTYPHYACAFYDDLPCPSDGNPASAGATPIIVAVDEIREDIDFHFDVDHVFANGFEP